MEDPPEREELSCTTLLSLLLLLPIHTRRRLSCPDVLLPAQREMAKRAPSLSGKRDLQLSSPRFPVRRWSRDRSRNRNHGPGQITVEGCCIPTPRRRSRTKPILRRRLCPIAEHAKPSHASFFIFFLRSGHIRSGIRSGAVGPGGLSPKSLCTLS